MVKNEEDKTFKLTLNICPQSRIRKNNVIILVI